MEKVQAGGRISRGWQVTKSSWRVLMLDKELIGLPAINFVLSSLVLLGFGLATMMFLAHQQTGSFNPAQFSINYDPNQIPQWLHIAGAVVLYVVLTTIANIFGAAIVYGATERFNGGDPTLRSSMKGAMRKIRPLILFSLMMSTVGLVLQALEERVPLAGRIAVWLAGAAWSVANIFAIPVIVLGKGNVAPLTATKKSVKIIGQVWGESVVADIGISVIAGLSIIAYTLISITVGVSLFSLSTATPLVVTTLAVILAGLVALILVFSALTSIAKAALYHYATTGKAPEDFNKQLLKDAMTRKKARKVFA